MKTMKKKIITLCLVIAMLSVAVIGGTLAYFTDVDQATNEFTVGNVSIDLYETVDHKDGADNPKPIKVNGEVSEDLENIGENTDDAFTVEYAPAMPGDTLTKVVTVENDGTEPAYVALSIVQDNYGTGRMVDPDNWFNHRIDNYYEKAPLNYTDEQMQKLTSAIFAGEGWNVLAYTHRGDAAADGITAVSNMRYYPTAVEPEQQNGDKTYVGDTRTEPVVIAIDYSVSGHGKNDTNMLPAAVYDECAAGTRIWVYYLYMPAKTSYTLDLTIKVPEVIDEYSIKAFEGMTLDVRSAAIQVSGFATAKAAFETLEEQFSFNYAEAHDPRPTEATEPTQEETTVAP